jgi:mannose-6-phosphate isomerase-like protein (cupin superfamily)
MASRVWSESEAPLHLEPDDTAAVRVTIGADQGSARLEQRVVRYASGRSLPRRADRDDVMYVASGSGTIELEGERHGLAPDDAVLVAAGETFVVDNPGPEELVVVSVLVPASDAGVRVDRRVVVPLSGREEERADENRTFRVLVAKDTGCPDVTQFIGFVQPCRAPDHSHPYDEVGFILAGHGFAHVDGETIPIGPGSCFHLPPGKVHCIESVGPELMRILGVFHPSDSPASRSYDASGSTDAAASTA